MKPGELLSPAHLTVEAIKLGLEAPYHLAEVRGPEHLHALTNAYRESPFPILFAFNHIDIPEAVWIYGAALDIVGDSANLIMPVSEHYLKSNSFPLYRAAVALAQTVSESSFPPVIQSYRKRGEQSDETEQSVLVKRSRELSLSLARQLVAGFSRNKCVLIAPEGHRSYDGSLLPAEDGAGFMVEQLAKLASRKTVHDARVVPVAFELLDRRGFVPRKRFRMSVGAPVRPQQIIDAGIVLTVSNGLDGVSTASATAHALMLMIAGMLPPDKQGVYQKDDARLPRVLNGNIRLGIDRTGRTSLIEIP